MRRVRLRAVFAAAAVTVALLPASSSAGQVATLTMSVARSGATDIAVPRGAVLDMGRSRVTGAGSYYGYYLQPLDARPDAGIGEMWVAAFTHGSFAPFRFPLGGAESTRGYRPTNVVKAGTRQTLNAGRYRLHVLGDRTTRVALTVSGAGASRTLRATRTSPFRATTQDVTAPMGQPRAGVVTAEIPFTVTTADSMTFLAMFFAYRTADKASSASWNECLGSGAVAAACQAGKPVTGHSGYQYGYQDAQYRVTHPVPLSEMAIGYAGFWDRGTAPVGELRAHYYVAAVGAVDKFAVAAFSLAY